MTSVPRNHSVQRAICLFILLVLAVPFSLGQGLERAEPEAVGMSTERLERMADVMDAYVENGRIAGSVTLILKDGHIVYERASGMRDKESGDPMELTDMFRIASMTKAIVSTAVLILQEQGKLSIQDPVGKHLPEWMETTVAVEAEGGYEIVPANRPIRIRDMLTHQAGVGMGAGLAAEHWEAADIQYWYLADKPEGIREVARTIASLPMDAHPGERYVYGLNQDVLGAVVEVASGQPLDEFLDEHLLTPLGMEDTYFFVPEEKADRLAVVYGGSNTGIQRLDQWAGHFHGQGHYLEGPRATFGGGAGLVSTAYDYARFLQMYLNKGELNGVRILSPTTVELALSHHVEDPWGNGSALGLPFGIIRDLGAYGQAGSVGEFSWGGAYHTSYFASPQHNMAVVYMTQIMNPGPGLDDFTKLRTMSHQAIVN